jgi:hypothetical protein
VPEHRELDTAGVVAARPTREGVSDGVVGACRSRTKVKRREASRAGEPASRGDARYASERVA